MPNKFGHGKDKRSVVNLKKLVPTSCQQPFGELEYQACDPLCHNSPSVTWWTGKSWDHCEERWSITFKQARQKKFEIPGIPWKFMIVNGEIYYRQNVEA